MRKKFSITIEEMISKTFEVFAENDEQAENIAIENTSHVNLYLTLEI